MQQYSRLLLFSPAFCIILWQMLSCDILNFGPNLLEGKTHLDISCVVTKLDAISSVKNQLWRYCNMGFIF